MIMNDNGACPVLNIHISSTSLRNAPSRIDASAIKPYFCLLGLSLSPSEPSELVEIVFSSDCASVCLSVSVFREPVNQTVGELNAKGRNPLGELVGN